MFIYLDGKMRDLETFQYQKKVQEEQCHWIGDNMLNQKALRKIAVAVGHTPTISTKHFLIMPHAFHLDLIKIQGWKKILKHVPKLKPVIYHVLKPVQNTFNKSKSLLPPFFLLHVFPSWIDLLAIFCFCRLGGGLMEAWRKPLIGSSGVNVNDSGVIPLCLFGHVRRSRRRSIFGDRHGRRHGGLAS